MTASAERFFATDMHLDVAGRPPDTELTAVGFDSLARMEYATHVSNISAQGRVEEIAVLHTIQDLYSHFYAVQADRGSSGLG